jgi:hypothetical protein
MTDEVKYVRIGGEEISIEEAASLVRMVCADAKQIAGVFHGQNRSEKFRKNWPDEYKFAETNWKTFIKAARALYAQKLADPKTPDHDARRMHLALVLEAAISEGVKGREQTDNRLQLQPGTQQFAGDRYENRKIIEKFGLSQNLRAALLNSTTTRH